MRALVAGAGGAIGRPLVRALVREGREVVAMTRSPGRSEALRLDGAEPVVADALDSSAVNDALVRARPDVVVHQLTAIPAAEATAAAVERGAPGVYNVVNDEPAAVAEWLPALATALGAKPRATYPPSSAASPSASTASDDDRHPRRVERKGQARAGLGADAHELAGRVQGCVWPPDVEQHCRATVRPVAS